MSDVMNSIFDRAKNENPDSGGYAYGTGTVEPEPEADEAIVVVEEADSAPEHESVAETAVETDEEAVAEDSSEDSEAASAEDDTDPNAVEDAPAAVAETEPAAARPAAGTRGSTTIADGVVSKIVVRIAAQTDGVHSLDESGIKVELADDVAWITIPVVVEFGHAVKALAGQIRVAVIEAVEQYLGLDVEVVDVHVTDIHFPEAD